MIILHASYADHHLHFWGEKPVDDLEGASKARGKKSPALFPYDAGEETLKEILTETLFDRSIRRQEADMRTVWLPTTGQTAIASSPLLSKNPVAHRNVAFEPWRVTAMSLPLESTIGFLAAFVGKELLSSGVMGGNDLMFWTKVMRFAGALKIFRHAPSLGGVESLIEHRRTAEGNLPKSPDNLLRLGKVG